jgi:hypothetical protein
LENTATTTGATLPATVSPINDSTFNELC